MRTLPDGFFLMVPTQLSALIETDLLSWPGKFSALQDLFSYPAQEDISAGDFLEARFGQEILDRIAEPMLAGIYGADIRRLSLKSGLPQIWELQKSGSLIKRLVSIRSGTPPSAASLFTTLRDGMESLPRAIVARLPHINWRLNSPVEYVEKLNHGWKIGADFYDALIVATSNIPAADRMAIAELRSVFASVQRNSAVVMAFGFERLKKEGFGWLVPAEERHSVLACTYSSNKFTDRSPEDRLVVRLFIGGKQTEDWLEREDDDLLKEGFHELKRIGQIDQQPVFSRVFRWQKAMPEYRVGHEALLSKIEELRTRESNFYLTGNLFAGVGIPDCIRHAKSVADTLAKNL
jgi:protoporphyrinogen oxidase